MYDYQLWITGTNGKPIPACGSDGVGYYDKRLSQANRLKVIKAHADQSNRLLDSRFIGYSSYKSNNFIPFN